MSETEGMISIPTGERIIHRSELFDAVIIQKNIQTGWTKDIFILSLMLQEDDPLVHREATVAVEKDIFYSVDKGEKVKLRMYEQADGSWTKMPPTDKAE